jgi:hypothetical protein
MYNTNVNMTEVKWFLKHCVAVQDSKQNQHSVVVAIDFGTTYSGYAYSFTSSPDDIHIMRKWEGNSLKKK